MKLTKSKLKQIIKEEIQTVLQINESSSDLRKLARVVIDAGYALTNGGVGVFDGDASEVRCHYPKLDKQLAPYANTILSIIEEKDVEVLKQILATIKSLNNTLETSSYTPPNNQENLLSTLVDIRNFLDDDAPCEELDDDDWDADGDDDSYKSDVYGYDTASIADWPKHWGRVHSSDDENNLRWSL